MSIFRHLNIFDLSIYHPLAPQDFDIVKCTDRSITMKWKYVSTEVYQYYELDHRLKGSADWNSLPLSTEDISIKNNVFRLYEFQDLLPETYYELRICLVDNRIKSHFTESKTQQTLKTGKDSFVSNHN